MNASFFDFVRGNTKRSVCLRFSLPGYEPQIYHLEETHRTRFSRVLAPLQATCRLSTYLQPYLCRRHAGVKVGEAIVSGSWYWLSCLPAGAGIAWARTLLTVVCEIFAGTAVAVVRCFFLENSFLIQKLLVEPLQVTRWNVSSLNCIQLLTSN